MKTNEGRGISELNKIETEKIYDIFKKNSFSTNDYIINNKKIQITFEIGNYNSKYYKKLNTISPKAKMIKMADFADHLRNFIKMRKADPTSSYHNQYILFIREFLNNYPDSEEKNILYKLTEELDIYVTERLDLNLI